MRLLCLTLASLSAVFAGVDGVVMNGTTGKPQPGVLVTMVQPSQTGMQTIATVKSDAQGIFKIDQAAPPGGPSLLQAVYGGVLYTKVLTPGAPTTAIAVNVFDSSTNPASGKVAQDMILIEPGPGGINVTETILFDNETKQTYSNPQKGSAQFFVAEAARGNIQVTVATPNGVPVQRPAEKTKTPGIYKADYPIKPGQTRFDISYTLPAGDTFLGQRVDTSVPLRLVVPSTVSLSGDDISMLTTEPQTQAKIYDVKSTSYKASIEGTGSIRSSDGAAQQGEEDDGHPQVESHPARIYSQLPWVLGLTLAILGLGGAMLYRKGAA